MGLFNFKKNNSESNQSKLEWNTLDNIDQIDEIITASKDQPVVILKHSTRCSISTSALARLERSWSNEVKVTPYYLDLIANRNVSNELATRFAVEHQSPQILLIKDGVCTFDTSHNNVRVEGIIENL